MDMFEEASRKMLRFGEHTLEELWGLHENKLHEIYRNEQSKTDLGTKDLKLTIIKYILVGKEDDTLLKKAIEKKKLDELMTKDLTELEKMRDKQ